MKEENLQFRAWDKEHKRFIRHKFFITDNGQVYIPCDPYGIDMSGKYRIQGIGNDVEINSYTGLSDKNGTWIFEKDILKIDDTYCGDRLIKSYNAVVEFQDGNYMISGEASYEMLAVNPSFWEVIGNIYKNSELLK